MPRHNRTLEGLVSGSCKIRKRNCSSSSSTTSSVVHNYRFKRAVVVGKARGSRSSTPVPAWKTTSSSGMMRAVVDSPRYAPSQGGGGGGGAGSRPVSARKLAATLWEMNEVHSPRRREKREVGVRERMSAAATRSVYSGSLPPHLSDPSHSPVSERMDRSGMGSRHRRTSSISVKHRLADHNGGLLDSLSSASLMEIETGSRVQTPIGSVVGGRTRLKDVSNALTTSKELLKIINRVWAQADHPSPSMSLVSALHAELERARLQVNQLIQEQRSDQNEIKNLIKCFAEEKEAWKNKEERATEAAIEAVASELEVERKLRRRLESLNKKLGKELAETKASLVKAVKEVESEKRAREVMEQVCDELARDIDEDKAEAEELKRGSTKQIHEEAEKEREMLRLADVLHEERVQRKIFEARNQFEEKNGAVDNVRNHIEAFLRNKRGKERGRYESDQNQEKEDGGEVDDGVDCEEEDSGESDLHSIEFNMESNNKSQKWACASRVARDSRRVPIHTENKARNSVSAKELSRRSTSLQRSISDGVDWGFHTENGRNFGDGLDLEQLYEVEKQSQRKTHQDDIQNYISAKGLRDHILSSSRMGSTRDFASPVRDWGPSRGLGNAVQERPTVLQGSGMKPRLAEAKGEGQNVRRSKR